MPQVPNLQFPGLSNRGQAFISPHLRVGMTFYPQKISADNLFVPKRGTKSRELDWQPRTTEGSIVSFQWSKRMGQPAGQWTAVVKQKRIHDSAGPKREGVRFDRQEVSDGDWCDVAIQRNGLIIPLCRGVLDGVRGRKSSAGGATTVIYTLSGRDHGAFFTYPITWNNIWAQTLRELVAGLFTSRIQGKVGGRPDEMFKALIDGTFKGGEKSSVPSGQWLLPESLRDTTGLRNKLSDLLTIVPFNALKGSDLGLRGAYYNEPQLWTVGEQNLHQTLSQWTNPLLNEYWYDLLPPDAYMPKHGLNGFLKQKTIIRSGKLPSRPEDLFVEDDQIGAGEVVTTTQSMTSDGPRDFGDIAAIIREKPFPTKAAKQDSMWFSLPTWVIPTWLCEDIDLGRSGDQRFNLFELLADFGLGSQQEQAAFSQPQWDREDIARHGLRALSQNTRFFSNDSAGLGAWFEERSEWLQLLVDWYAPNPYLLQGSIAVKTLLPEVRIGHRVILTNGNPTEDIQLYVEGVDLTYQSPAQTSGAAGSTSLIVTRGFQGSDEELIDATTKLSDLHKEVF
jgi:hypothetical protein